MATANDHYWDRGKTVKKSFRVTFVNKLGKRQTTSFQCEEAAKFFFTEICKKEQRWKAETVLRQLEGIV